MNETTVQSNYAEIYLPRFPMPPSINKKLAISGGRLRNTRAFRDYNGACEIYFYQNGQAINLSREQVAAWLTCPEFVLSISVFLHFPKKKVFHGDKIKYLDEDNRLKPVRDMVANMLWFDDKHFFSSEIYKLWHDGEDEWATVVIKPQLKNELEFFASEVLRQRSV